MTRQRPNTRDTVHDRSSRSPAGGAPGNGGRPERGPAGQVEDGQVADTDVPAGVVVGVLCEDPRLRHLVVALLGATPDVDAIVPVSRLSRAATPVDLLVTTPQDRLQVAHDPRLPVLLVVAAGSAAGRADAPVAARADATAVARVHAAAAAAADAAAVAVDADAMCVTQLRRLIHDCLPDVGPPRQWRLEPASINGRYRPLGTSRSLTLREEATVLLMAAGLSNEHIGARLGISMHGVKRLVSSVMLKLGAANRTGAVMLAIEHGVIIFPWLVPYRPESDGEEPVSEPRAGSPGSPGSPGAAAGRAPGPTAARPSPSPPPGRRR